MAHARRAVRQPPAPGRLQVATPASPRLQVSLPMEIKRAMATALQLAYGSRQRQERRRRKARPALGLVKAKRFETLQQAHSTRRNKERYSQKTMKSIHPHGGSSAQRKCSQLRQQQQNNKCWGVTRPKSWSLCLRHREPCREQTGRYLGRPSGGVCANAGRHQIGL